MNERTIFLAALERDDPQERNSFLDAACGEDAGLRNSVDELIRAHNDAGSFLEKPPVEIETTAPVVYENNDAADNQQVDPDHSADPTNIEITTSDDIDLSFLDPCKKPDTLGRLGSYEITAVIGRGGMGVVLKGRDPELNRVVAIKVLAPELALNAMARKRFLREARAAAAISHDHVVTIHSINQTGQLPHLAMEYVDGQSLQQRLDRSGPLGLKEILRIGKQTASGLAAAHAEGLIHRDIKPANILLENGVERVKITDFGLARAVDDVSLTQTGVVAGTPQYMSPEQGQGQRVDHRTDLFSLGSVLYAMCTGRPPFRADSTMAVICRVCDDTPRPIQQVNPDIPDWLVTIIDKLLAKDPNQRFESATEVAELLGQHLAHIQQPSLVSQPVPLPQTADRSQPGNATRRSTKQRWAVTAVLLIVLFGGLSFTEATGRTQITSTITATVIRIVTGEGTLVVEVDDPEVSIQIDGEELIIKGAGVREIRVRPGKYRIQALKNGKSVHQELVTITRGGRVLVRVTRVPTPPQPEVMAKAGPPVREISQATRIFAGLKLPVYNLVFLPDGRRALSAGPGSNVCLWDLQTCRVLRRFEGHTGNICSVAFSPDGRYAMSGSLDKTARLWDVETGKEIRQLGPHDAGVSRVAVSPDGHVAATFNINWRVPGKDHAIRLWDVKTGTEIRRLEGHVHEVMSLEFSPDGLHLLSGSKDMTVRLWDIATGREIRRFQGHQTMVYSVTFSPDGRYALSSSVADEERGVKNGKIDDPENCVICLWEMETGRLVRRFTGHRGAIRSVEFSPNGRLVLSASGGQHIGSGGLTQSVDNSVRIWDAGNGRELCRFQHSQSLIQATFSPDGRSILSCGNERLFRLWRLPESVWPAAAQAGKPEAQKIPRKTSIP